MMNLSNSKSDSQSEQRYFPRWHVKSRALFQFENQLKSNEAQTLDISCAGASLLSTTPLYPNQKIKVTIDLSPSKSINVDGKVIWAQWLENSHKVGIHFENIPQKIQETILQFAFEVKPHELKNNWFKGWES